MPSAIVTANLVESAAGVTVSTEDTTYVKTNLYDKIAANPFRFTGTTGGTIEVDNGAAKTFDTLGLCNHNFAAGVTVTAYGGATSPAASLLASPAYRARTIWADLGASPATSYRYMLVNIQDGNTVATGLGQLVLGVRTELPRAHRWGKTVGRDREQIIHETLRKVVHAYDLANQDVRIYSWRVLDTELPTFDAVEAAIEGRLYPFLWVEDTAGTDAWYARLQQSNYRPVELQDGLYYDITWALTEEAPGVTLLS